MQLLSSGSGDLDVEGLPPKREVDLWIVGCGKLGMLVASQWLEMHPDAVVVGETKSSKNHEAIIQVGAIPRLRSQRNELEWKRIRHVLISLPPYSKSPETAANYLSEIMAAMDLRGADLTVSNSIPRILLISTTSVYGDMKHDKFKVTEFSPVADNNNKEYASASRSIEAERIALQRNGIVLRLAGLYDRHRGPHMYWLSSIASKERTYKEKGEYYKFDIEPDGLVNLLHYEDAALAATKSLLLGIPGTIYMACDGNPISRRDIIESAASSGLIDGFELPEYSRIFKLSGTTTNSKICDCSWTRNSLNWFPIYPRFDHFIRNI